MTRRYHLSPEFIDTIEPELQELAEQSYGARQLDTLDGIERYYSTQYFRNLSDVDKGLSLAAIRAHELKAEWGLGSSINEDGLFPVQLPSERLSFDETDASVMSGAAGAYVAEYRSDEEEVEKQYTLSQLKQLGVLAMNLKPIDRGRSINLPAIREQPPLKVTVSGDIHGDFSMFISSLAHQGSITPYGTLEVIAPVDEYIISGYHSVEPNLVNCMIEHLAGKYSSEEKEILYKQIVTNEGEWSQRGIPGTGFADYGFSSGSLRFLREWIPEENLQSGSVMESLTVYPGRRNVTLDVVKGESGIHLKQMVFGDEDVEAGECVQDLFIDNNNIPGFIETLGLADAGRTSPIEILALLQSRLLSQEGDRAR